MTKTKTTAHPADQFITTRPVFHGAVDKGFYLDVPNGPSGAFHTRAAARGAYTAWAKRSTVVAQARAVNEVSARFEEGPQVDDDKCVTCVCGQRCTGDVTRVSLGARALLVCGRFDCIEIASRVLDVLATNGQRWWDFPAANHIDRVDWFRRAAFFAR